MAVRLPVETPQRAAAAAVLPYSPDPPSTDLEVLFPRAAELAFFVVGDRSAALAVAVEAMAKLPAAVRVQDRRRAYQPKGRLRTRVNADPAHVVQRLVLIETEHWERQQEGAGTVGARPMLVRYVKHLVRITLRRNSFYVALGLSRLLYRYETAETIDLYSLLIQGADRLRDDHYYRSRKKQLLEEIGARFGDLLVFESGPRGERRIRTTTADDDTKALVRDCLLHFTPWGTACVVPERFDPWSAELQPLLFDGSEPDAEHPVEMNRIHAAIEPVCFARLAYALQLAPPEERLAPPEFQMPHQKPDDGPPASCPVGEEDRARLQDRLNEDARRRRTRGPVLRVLVDGTERATLDPDRRDHVRLRLGEGTEIVEVRASADEVVALWVAGVDAALDGPVDLVVRAGTAEGPPQLEIHDARRDAHAWWRLLEWLAIPRWQPAWAALAVASIALVGALWPPWRPPAQEVGPTAPPAPAPMRGDARTPSLSDVHEIFVDPLSGGAAAHALRSSLTDALRGSGRFSVPARRSEADAVLVGAIGADGALQLELVAPRGEVLWSARRRVAPTDSLATVAAELLLDLRSQAASRAAPTASRP